MPKKKTAAETEENMEAVEQEINEEMDEQAETDNSTESVEVDDAGPVKKKKKAAPRKGLKDRIMGDGSKRPGSESQPSTIFYLHALFLMGGRILTGLLDIYNNIVGLDAKDKAKIYRNVSNHYLKKGLNQKAIDSLKEWSRLEPTNPEPNFQLALALAAAGRDKQAIVVLNKVLKLDPGHTGAIYRRSKLLLKRKEYGEAINGLQPLAEANPDNAEIQFLLGVAYSRSEQMDLSVIAMEKAVKLEPESSKYHQFLGFLYEQKGDHKNAAACFTKVMELEEQNDGEEDID